MRNIVVKMIIAFIVIKVHNEDSMKSSYNTVENGVLKNIGTLLSPDFRSFRTFPTATLFFFLFLFAKWETFLKENISCKKRTSNTAFSSSSKFFPTLQTFFRKLSLLANIHVVISYKFQVTKIQERYDTVTYFSIYGF